MDGTARFIVSLDCEGKWGMADHLHPYHHQLLTDAALARVYEQLVDMFARYEIPATFAYVMAFVLSPEEREHFAHKLLGDEQDEWLRPYRKAARDGQLGGWHQPAALDIVRAVNMHEIACHSFCHRPIGDAAISAEGADAELDAAIEAAHMKKLSLQTFVFPRNEPGHLRVLRSHGFIGYRQRLSRPRGVLGRAVSLAEEFNVWATPQRPNPVVDGLVPIPSGRFLNWRFGLRNRVPATATVERWRHQLRKAATTGGVVHLWLHPHNLITGPSTATLLEQVLAEVATMRDGGQVRVLTQRDYCREEMMVADIGRTCRGPPGKAFGRLGQSSRRTRAERC
jgi:peptidoglycan/xylan/chitin deacetylase (PgdA/CDA1 family)